MDENPPTHPGIPEESYTYQKLGNKTLAIFVLQRIGAPLVLCLVSIGLLSIQGESFINQIPIPDFGKYVSIVAWGCFTLFVIFFGLAFLIAWLVYINYKFALGDNSLKIKRGILNKEEIAIPYRQIQDVDITRDISFQLLGLSRIVILTAGHEDGPNEDEAGEQGQSEGYLPALDKELAEWLQAELLKRANVQKVTEEK